MGSMETWHKAPMNASTGEDNKASPIGGDWIQTAPHITSATSGGVAMDAN